jgi:hypothetical protein
LIGAARVAWREPTRAEDKGGRRGEGGDNAVGDEDEQPAVHEFPEFDAAAGPGSAVRTGGQLHPADTEANGVVAGDEAGVATAEQMVDVARCEAPGRG